MHVLLGADVTRQKDGSPYPRGDELAALVARYAAQQNPFGPLDWAVRVCLVTRDAELAATYADEMEVLYVGPYDPRAVNAAQMESLDDVIAHFTWLDKQIAQKGRPLCTDRSMALSSPYPTQSRLS